MRIGILVSPFKSSPEPLYAEMLVVSHMEGVRSFVFQPDGVNINAGRIIGYSYDPNRERWLVGEMEIPDVVYNQVRSRRVENSEGCQKVMDFLTSQGTVLLNKGFLSKDIEFKCLYGEPEMHPYIPETHTFALNQVTVVLDLIKRYKSVFIKPVDGSLGLGIIKVSSRSGDSFSVSLQRADGGRHMHAKGYRELRGILTRLTKGRRYIIQQGISLVNPRGGPADFRVIVQKAGADEWQHTYTLARVSVKGAIVSNVAAGASLEDPDDVLEMLSMGDTQILRSYMTRLAIKASDVMDSRCGPFSEMGVDIGMDVSGRLWVIEVNSKYAIDVLPKRIRELSMERTLKYAQYLLEEDNNDYINYV